MALAESVLPVGTVIASPQRTAGGSTDSLPQITQVNYRDVDAAIEIQSRTKALILSVQNTAERNALVAKPGMILFNEETGLYEGYDNNDQWAAIGGGGGSITPVFVEDNTEMESNHMYIVDSVDSVLLNLPSFPDFGDVIEILGVGAGLWTVTQDTFDGTTQVRLGNVTTTQGFTGTMTSTAQGDGVRMVYIGDGLWQVNPAPQGNLNLA